MPNTHTIISMSISNPAFVKRKVFFTLDAGNDHGRILFNWLCFLTLERMIIVMLNFM